mgnify:CR=1 FL=1
MRLKNLFLVASLGARTTSAEIGLGIRGLQANRLVVIANGEIEGPRGDVRLRPLHEIRR